MANYTTPYMLGSNPHVVGILGGMGSYATLHFFKTLLDAFPVEKEWQRPRIVIDNHCVLPSRTRALLYDGEGREELVRGMADSLRSLLEYAPDVIAIPCNTAHSFLDEVYRQCPEAEPKVLHMLELVALECESAGVKEAFLLATEGTLEARTYDPPLEAAGVTLRHPSPAQLVEIRGFIEDVKQNPTPDVPAFERFLRGLGTEAVILGCTELSALVKTAEGSGGPGPAVIDPVLSMAREIRRQTSTPE